VTPPRAAVAPSDAVRVVADPFPIGHGELAQDFAKRAESRAASAARGQRGQAAVEVIAALPALVIVGLIMFQLLALGYSAVLVGVAAEAGGLALALDRDPTTAARAAVPGWSRARMRVDVDGREVRVVLSPPMVIPGVGRRLQVRALAAVARR